MNKFLRKGMVLVIIPFILASVVYAMLLLYYKSNMSYGTWINDIYCTGLSVDEVDSLLQDLPLESANITVHTLDDTVQLSYLAYIDTVDYTDALKLNAFTYNPFVLFSEKHIEIEPSVTLNQSSFCAYLMSMDFMQSNQISEVSILETELGYELIDTTKDRLDILLATESILDAILNGEKEISLLEVGCYTQDSYSQEDYDTINLYKELDAFTHTIAFNLTVGDEIYCIDASILMDWVSIEDDGEIVLDEEAVYAYVDRMDLLLSTRADRSNQLSSYERQWNFINHDGEEILVKAGSYGRILDKEALYNFLIDSFITKTSVDYELIFSYFPEEDNNETQGLTLPNTYLEVDIENQHIYLFENGIEIFDSACVTGNLSTNDDTPDGVYYIDYMQKGRTLVGDTYRTYVNYWMRFYSLCGFHDATWRSSFGDDIYEYSGSHGCVNMPKDKAEELYGLVYIGLPVIIY
ncbi:MAG: L,D-transpeptidase [Lachnospiraceae bacterium]